MKKTTLNLMLVMIILGVAVPQASEAARRYCKLDVEMAQLKKGKPISYLTYQWKNAWGYKTVYINGIGSGDCRLEAEALAHEVASDPIQWSPNSYYCYVYRVRSMHYKRGKHNGTAYSNGYPTVQCHWL